MSQTMPEMQEAQAKFQKARRIGNQADSEYMCMLSGPSDRLTAHNWQS